MCTGVQGTSHTWAYRHLSLAAGDRAQWQDGPPVCDRGRQGEDDSGKGIGDFGCQRRSWYYIFGTIKSQLWIQNQKQGFSFQFKLNVDKFP